MTASPPPPADGDDDAPILDLERFVPYQLSLLSNVVSQEIAEAYGERFGLAITEWRILAVLGRFPGLSAVGVAERSAMDKVAVSRAVRNLVDRALMVRKIPDQDRRSRQLALTDEGHNIYSEVIRRARVHEMKLLAGLSSDDLNAFNRILDELESMANKVGSPGML